MEAAGEESRSTGESLRRAGNEAGQARRRPRVSRVAGGVAAAILLAMLLTYALSMSAGGMDHTMSDAALPQDGAAADAVAPSTGGQMVMADGSTMDMGEHPSESPAAAAPDADHVASEPGGGEHEMAMGGTVNWYLIGGILALVAAGIALAAGLKEHLARRIAMGTLVTGEVCSE